MNKKKKPVSVHPQVTASAFVVSVVALITSSLAWAGITVPADVVASSTAVIGFVVWKLWPSLP